MVVVRTTSVEYLDAWREREIDVDFMVSSELETANAISGLIGIPAARQTDVFADGKVQVVEFDVPEASTTVIGTPLRERDAAERLAQGRQHHPRRRADLPAAARASCAGDRIVVIALAQLGARVEPGDVDTSTSASTTS